MGVGSLLIGVVFCTLVGEDATAQSAELLVQPVPESPLRDRLKSGVVPKQSRDSLFAGVRGVSSVFPSPDRGAKGTGNQRASIGAYRLTVTDSSALRRLRSKWLSHPDVRYAHPNYRFRVHARRPSSPAADPPSILRPRNVLTDSLDHLRVVRAVEAWTATAGTSAVRIGVVDTGFFLSHPDLETQYWVNSAEDINGNGQFDPYPADEGGDLNGIDDDGNGYVDDVIGYDFVDRSAPIDEGEFRTRDPIPSADPKQSFSWHGTAVAGVATAAPGAPEAGIAGVAPRTKLVALRALGGDGFGRADDIAAAIAYAATQNVDVLNLSFGRARAVPLIEDAVEYANEQGTVVVASAGNDLTDDPHYPSDYSSVLSVVWLGEDGRLPQFNRSQFGIGVDLGAPGSDVYTADFPGEKIDDGREPSRNDLYRSPNGSSFSAPQVAGAAALLRSADSSLSPASIRSILTASATDIEGANWDHKTGAGLLDVRQSLLRAYPARTQIDRPRHDRGVRGRSPVPIVGSAVDPAFEHYALYYAEGTKNLDVRPDPWVEITAPQEEQVLRDTLGVWSPSGLGEGAYTLRLVTRLRDGRTIEDRRRIRIDASPPTIDLQFLGVGRVDGDYGIVADVETDDVTRGRLQIASGQQSETIRSDQRARRHGLFWADDRGDGGRVRAEIRVTNATGLTTTLDTSLRVPEARENTGLLRRSLTGQPRGRLLPETVDFDGDGLREVLMNQFRDGGISDTLRTFEWNGSALAPADTLVTGPLFPKDVGDTNGDGRQELLLQVRGATFLLEQSSSGGIPDEVIFADTSRVSNAPGDTLNGTLLTDLDADGQGEILGSYEDRWRLIERKPSGFEVIANLENPTSIGPDSTQGNAFDFPAAQTGDFDGDGRRDLLVGDRDGDLLVYEATGNDAFTVAWTHETDRVDAGTRFAAGDFSGTGRTDFVTMTTTPSGARAGEEAVVPSISFYTIWRRTGPDAYEPVHRLPITGPFASQGALGTADVDADDRPEIAIVHPPSLLILDQKAGGSWRVLFEDRPSGVLSRSLLAADVTGSGRPSVFAGTNDGKLVRYAVDQGALAVAPPRWAEARPSGPQSSLLKWRAPGADSVTVYAGAPGNDLDRILTTRDSAATVSGASPRRFVLRAWSEGALSPLSKSREVRPHAPATVTEASYPSSSSIRLSFTEPLAPDVEADQFRFGKREQAPSRLTSVRNGAGVVLHFSSRVVGESGILTWTGVRDRTGFPLGQTSLDVTFPERTRRTLYVQTSTILGERRLRLSFNEPLDPNAARQTERYQVQPRGRVTDVQIEDPPSKTVTLRIDGLVIGARGEEASLTVRDMEGASGGKLAEEGRTVRLTKPADDLSNVYVFPNPHRARQHGDNITIGGLPMEATIRVYTPGGRLVNVLSVDDNRNGGYRWDLRNRRGERVPSGVYLFRVSAPDQSPVLEKAAVIR